MTTYRALHNDFWNADSLYSINNTKIYQYVSGDCANNTHKTRGQSILLCCSQSMEWTANIYKKLSLHFYFETIFLIDPIADALLLTV